MKLIILGALFAFATGAKLNRAYLPPNFAQTSGGSSEFLQTPLINSQNNEDLKKQIYQNPAYNYQSDDSRFVNIDQHQENFFDRRERLRASFERNDAILRQINENNGETYSYGFETENGIVAEENGDATNGVEAQGGYSYTGDDGQVYSVRYTAGKNGFVPEGDHLPTPPPIPHEILMALEQNARDEAAGIFDDGSYREENYSSGNREYQATSFGQNRVTTDSEDDSIVINSAFNSDVSLSPGFRAAPTRPELKDDGVTKAYLPPTGQRTGNRNSVSGYGNTRRTSYNARSGYHY